MQSTPDDKPFDWLLDDSIVIERQDPLAVYLNNADHIVIRREAAWDEEHDTTIIIAPQNVTAFLQAVMRASGLPLELVRRIGPGSYEDVDEPHHDAAEGQHDGAEISVPKPAVPKDATAAERQRRHREKLQRNGVTDGSVTDRHGDDRDGTLFQQPEQIPIAAE